MGKKSLGKLTPEQLARLLKLGEELPKLEDLSSLVADRPKLRRAIEELGIPFQWAWAYELSFLELIALLICVLGGREELARAASSDDPQEILLAAAERGEEPDVDAASEPAWRKILVLELLIAVSKCFECLRSYSMSICDLVAKARSGDVEPILKAVRIDPSVLATPSIAERVSLAELHSDKRFLKQVKSAYATPRRKLAVYSDLRFVETVLRDAGAFEHAPSEHIYEVVVSGLGLYDHRGADARKGLLTLFKRWRDSATT